MVEKSINAVVVGKEYDKKGKVTLVYVMEEYGDKYGAHVRERSFSTNGKNFEIGESVVLGRPVSPSGVIGKIEIIKSGKEDQKTRLWNIRQMMNRTFYTDYLSEKAAVVEAPDYNGIYEPIIRSECDLYDNESFSGYISNNPQELAKAASYRMKKFTKAIRVVATENADLVDDALQGNAASLANDFDDIVQEMDKYIMEQAEENGSNVYKFTSKITNALSATSLKNDTFSDKIIRISNNLMKACNLKRNKQTDIRGVQ